MNVNETFKRFAIQTKLIPTPSRDELGKIYQYVGLTTDDFKEGYFYKCVESQGVYSRENVKVQDGDGASGDISDLDDVEITNPTEWQIMSFDETSEKWKNKEVTDINADYTLSKYSVWNSIWPTNYGVKRGWVGSEWETFHMYPMFKGDTIKVVNGSSVLSPWKIMVIYDTNKDFVTSFGWNSKTYTFENDWYVTFLTYTTQSSTPTVQITRAHKIDYSVNLQENALNQSVERNVLVDISEYLKPNNYLKTDNTLQSFNGRYSYKDIPLKKWDILQAYLWTWPSASWATQSLIVRNDSTIVNTWQGMTRFYATENCTYSCCWDNVNVSWPYVRVYRPQVTTVWTLITNLENTKADKESITPIKRAAIGDSITAWNEGNTWNSYSRTAARLVGERVKLQNLWYWGHTMKQSLATTAYNAISAWTNIITINFGSNDIFVLGSSQWWDVDEVIAKSREELADNVSSLESLRLFIEKCRENKPEATIYYITAIKRGADETHMAFNEKVIALCNHYSIQVLDAYHECSIRQSDTVYKRDGIHPNDNWCTVYGRWLANKINFL